MKTLKDILIILNVIFLIWLGLSYIEIISKNLSPNPTYSEYNIIVNIVDWANEYNQQHIDK